MLCNLQPKLIKLKNDARARSESLLTCDTTQNTHHTILTHIHDDIQKVLVFVTSMYMYMYIISTHNCK